MNNVTEVCYSLNWSHSDIPIAVKKEKETFLLQKMVELLKSVGATNVEVSDIRENGMSKTVTLQVEGFIEAEHLENVIRSGFENHYLQEDF